MKFGVLAFSYANSQDFAGALRKHGCYSVNLGDNAQSIAAGALFHRLGIRDEDIVSVDRDTLPDYRGERVALLMNAVFHDQCFPISKQVTPLFVGFTAQPEVLRKHVDYLRSHAPIGCRDCATAEVLTSLGVEAYVSGCVTFTLRRRSLTTKAARLIVVHGARSGALPNVVLRHVPSDLLESAEFIYHRLPVTTSPISATEQQTATAYEASIIRRLASKAAIVLTSLHHVTAPCLAMGIPVVLCRVNNHPRFSLLQRIIPLYTPDTVDQIDWAPAVPDVSCFANAYTERVRDLIKAAG
jgi:hypothetical protein